MEINKTTDKAKAIRAVINNWLRDQTKYCNMCGLDYSKATYPCCDEPQVGTNFDVCMCIVAQNKDTKALLDKPTAAVKSGIMRYAISLPPDLYETLKAYFKKEGEPFLKDTKDIRWFMKNFPEFSIPKSI